MNEHDDNVEEENVSLINMFLLDFTYVIECLPVADDSCMKMQSGTFPDSLGFPYIVRAYCCGPRVLDSVASQFRGRPLFRRLLTTPARARYRKASGDRYLVFALATSHRLLPRYATFLMAS
ncbi:unnamed protein product [Leptosia nina]|uniref:Uncharacterized protein n=1 Tax=Leptosia nina TaxID=320188 RepID=A0AAV1J9D7_9NEOP